MLIQSTIDGFTFWLDPPVVLWVLTVVVKLVIMGLFLFFKKRA